MGGSCLVGKLLIISIRPTTRWTITSGVCIRIMSIYAKYILAITHNGWPMQSGEVKRGRVCHQQG